MKKFILYYWIMFDMIDVIHMSKISNHYLLEYQTLLDSYEMQAPNVTNGFRVLDFSDDISDVDYTSEDWSLGESYSETSGEIHSLQGNPPEYSCSAGSKPLSLIIRRCNTPFLACSSPISKAEDENVSKPIEDSYHPSQIIGVNSLVSSETLVNADNETLRHGQLNIHSKVKLNISDDSTNKNDTNFENNSTSLENLTSACKSTDNEISCCQTIVSESIFCKGKASKGQRDNESKISEHSEQLKDSSSCASPKKGIDSENSLEAPGCSQKSPLHSFQADTKLSYSSNSENSSVEVDNSNTKLHHSIAGYQEKSVLENETEKEKISISKGENREEKDLQIFVNEPLQNVNNDKNLNNVHRNIEDVDVENIDCQESFFLSSRNKNIVENEVCIDDDLSVKSKQDHSVKVTCEESKINKISESSEVSKSVQSDIDLQYNENSKAVVSNCVESISDIKLNNGKELSPLDCKAIDSKANDTKTDKIEDFASTTNSKTAELNGLDKALVTNVEKEIVMAPVEVSNSATGPVSLLMKSNLEGLALPKIVEEPGVIGGKEPKQLTSHMNLSTTKGKVSANEESKAIEIATELSSKVLSRAFKQAGLTLSESLSHNVESDGVGILTCFSGIEQKLSVASKESQLYNPSETVSQCLIANDISSEFIESSLPLHTSVACQSVHKSTEVFSSAISGEQTLSSEPINAICMPSKLSCHSTVKDMETLFPSTSFSGNGLNVPGILMTSKAASSFCSSIQLEQKLSGGGGLAPDSWEAGLSFGDIGLHAPDGSFPDVADALNCEDLENSRLLSCSPLLFSSDDENSSVTEEVYKGIELALAPSPPPPPSSQRYANVVNEEKARVRRLQELLTGAPPPPAVTHPAFTAHDALEAVRERAPWPHAETETKPAGGVPLNRSDAWSKEASTTPWPLVKCLQYLGIHYNHGAASEQLESLYQKLASRCVGCETASSVCDAGAGAPPAPRRERRTQASAPRRPANAPPTGLSPGRRLSHLARRRRAFSSDALLAPGAPAHGTASGAAVPAPAAAPTASHPQAPPRLRAMLPHAQPERRTIMVAQTRKKTPKQRKSSGKKRNGRLDNYHSIHVAKLNSSKRALFQSPTDEERKPALNRSKFRPSGSLGSLSSKRALFTDDTPSGTVQLNHSVPSGSGEGSARKKRRVGSAKKRLREDSDEEFLKLPKRRLFGDAGTNEKLAQPLASTSKETSKDQANTKLSSTHKKKLLWAVAEALKEKGVGLAHTQFRVCAASLAARLQRGLVQQLLAQRQGSTSDKMLQLARSFVNEVVAQHGVMTT